MNKACKIKLTDNIPLDTTHPRHMLSKLHIHRNKRFQEGHRNEEDGDRGPGEHVLTWADAASVYSSQSRNVKCLICERVVAHGRSALKSFGPLVEGSTRRAKHTKIDCLGQPETAEHASKRSQLITKGSLKVLTYFRYCPCGSSFCGLDGQAQSYENAGTGCKTVSAAGATSIACS